MVDIWSEPECFTDNFGQILVSTVLKDAGG